MERKHSVNLLKVIAILLIFNSHSDILYPDGWSALATGGALGNSIFFIISGYFTRNRIDGWRAIVSRYVRLYLPVYMSIPVYALTRPGYLGDPFSIKRCFEAFVWPTPYWFVSASFVSFVLISAYVSTENQNRDRRFLRFTLLMVTVYAICYVFGMGDKDTWIVEDGKIFGLNVHFKCIYCFYLYVLGYHIKSSGKKLPAKIAAVLSLSCFALTYAIKILMQRNVIPMRFQFLTQACVCGFAVGALCAGLLCEDSYRQRGRFWISLIDNVSKLSLELYVTQILLIPFAAEWIGAPFPVNYVMTFFLALLLSLCLYSVDNKIAKALTGKLTL